MAPREDIVEIVDEGVAVESQTEITDIAIGDSASGDGDTDDYKNRVTENPDGTKTYRLLFPFTQRFRRPGGAEYEKTIDSITLRRMNGGDLKAIANFTNEEVRGIQLFQRLGGISDAVFEKIDQKDLECAFEVMGSFLNPTRKTGKTASHQ